MHGGELCFDVEIFKDGIFMCCLFTRSIFYLWGWGGWGGVRWGWGGMGLGVMSHHAVFSLGHKSLLLGSVSGEKRNRELWTLLNMQILAEIFRMSAKDYIAYVDNRPREGFLMYCFWDLYDLSLKGLKRVSDFFSFGSNKNLSFLGFFFLSFDRFS